MTRRSVYSIDAGLPFARALAAGVVRLAGAPERLARGLIMVPSRRAAKALQTAFLDLSDGAAMLLPQMIPIGDLADDDEAGVVLPNGDALPPPISGLRRQVNLAKLLRHFPLGGHYPSHPQAMMLADSLAQLLDQLYNAEATADQLSSLLPDQFSAHWQDIMTLLQILVQRWPDVLQAEGVIDAVDRRNRLIRAQADAWQQNPPDRLIVVAGSTGSIAATRALIGVVAGLPDGHVVLPGLDRHADEQWESIKEDSGHPQFQLAHLLAYLGLRADQVLEWGGMIEAPPPALAARRRLMREVFRPATSSDRWQQLGAMTPPIDRTALAGMKILTARDRREEASLVALALRDVLETPTRTAALVTPDRQLAEMVIAELQRWQIEIEDSAGQRLSLTPVGRFLQLLCDAVVSDFAPLLVLSLLKHPFACGGMDRRQFRRLVDRVELAAMRGVRPDGGLAGLADALDDADLKNFITDNLMPCLAPMGAAWQLPNQTLGGLASGLAETAELLAADNRQDGGDGPAESGALRLWDGPAGKAAAELLRDLTADGRDHVVTAADMPQIIHQLLDARTVHPHGNPHPRLAILGAVEARMHPEQAIGQHRIILAGFNEGNWPPHPDSDPWMNQAMRAAVGLPPRNWRTGLSAHDVYMAICSHDVVITRATKEAGTPTTKSRWLQRMDVVLSALRLDKVVDDGPREMMWLRHLTPVSRPHPAQRPAPCPPLASRPRQFSATEIDQWVTDPYAIYAKKILRLKPLDPVDRPLDAAIRGTLFHDALAAFIRSCQAGDLGPDALAKLRALGQREFASQMGQAAVRMFWWPRFDALAGWFIETERRRRGQIRVVYAEARGQIELAAPAGPVVLTARADRLEQDHDGNLTVIDYKTGSVPSKAQVTAGIRNQLRIEGLIAAEGGFPGLPAGAVVGLDYWQISGKKSAPGEILPRLDGVFDAAACRASFEALAARYDQPETTYPSEPDPTLVPAFKPYAHLSRSREWQTGGGDDD